MAEAVDVGQLRSVLECSVCLEQYENPKMLKCTHEFCKMCLEEIMEFQKDGSASIICPMRCSEKTILNKDSTVNDLAASYIAKNILETLKITNIHPEQQMPICSFGVNCAKHISLFCCGNAMCSTCYSKHANTGGDHRKVGLAYNKRDNKVMVMCDKHISLCTHTCQCGDDRLLCIYCTHRDQDHIKHAKIKIDAEVRLLREALANEFSSQMDCIKSFQDITRDKISTTRGVFLESVKKRKIRCLKQYNDFLNEEEERLMRNFDTLAETHMKQYTANAVTQFYLNQMKKYDVELVLMKNEIIQKINMDRCSATLKKDDIRWAGACEFRNPRPMGDIDVISTEEVVLLINSPVWSTFTYTLNTEGDAPEGASSLSVKTENHNVSEISKSAEQCSLKSNECMEEDVHVLKTQGNEYFKKYMYDKAIECYSKAIRHCPKENIADLCVFYQNRAAANEKLVRWLAVVDDCTKAIDLDPRYCKALHRRARAYKELGRKRSCLQDVSATCMLENFSNAQAIELMNSMSKEVCVMLAEDMLKNRQPVLPPSYYIRCHLRDFASGDLFIITVTNHKRDAVYSQIMENMKKDDYKSVLKLCTKEINGNGKHRLRCSLLRGILQDLMLNPVAAGNDFDLILKWYKTSRAHDPSSLMLVIDALCRIAGLKQRCGEVPSCFETLNFAFEVYPNSSKVFFHKARFLLMLGRRTEAIVNFEKSVSIDPNFEVGRLRLAYCLGLSDSQADVQEAINVYNETIRRFPQSAMAWCEYGIFLAELNRSNEAFEKFDKALTLDPTYMDTYDHKAKLLLRSDIVDAEQLLQRALVKDDKCYTIYNSLGRLETELNNYEAAVNYFRKSIPLIVDKQELIQTFELLVSAEEQVRLAKEYGRSPLPPYSSHSGSFRD